ncbi:hypothetical protein BDW59DRAFT_157081 [Aspergillus cavernicola]|uniref:Uncharacterized protein n=1 Tax=Aspergillus cavernicola TaxID=176166 RepID=A0ABR4J1H4_9EURO
MPLPKNNRILFERRRKEHNIVFKDALPPSSRPINHANVFEAIDQIKRVSYQSYGNADNGRDAHNTTPWRVEAKIHARRLAGKAHDCVARNESTWRLACEPLVFSRLSSEVACKNCRKRVWRSEVEAALDSEDGPAKKLKARQQNRDRCRCPRNTRPEDEDERVGLNRIFIDRAHDLVEHPPCLAQRLPQEQRPDRIYGLRQTRNFENLLLADLPNGEYLEDKLERPPHTGLGEPMLFPFLVVEAKAGNAADDWLSICLQTAFPIYTYLNNQQGLRLATGHRSRWTSGPLVWFFMSRGEDWRLYLAYQSPLDPGASSHYAAHTTNIVQAWAGSITNRDDAIQLFLIVDYLADWARDIYRPAALTELKILSSPDAEIATTFTDTDIFSTRDITINLSSGSHWNAADDANAAFRSLDTRYGAVRHIGPIESGFLSILITADNVQTFLLSMNRSIRVFFVRKLLNVLHSANAEPDVLSIDTINAIEEAWSGCSRLGTLFNLKDTKFFTVHLVTYYLSPFWSQVREFCMISVAEDALDTLITESQLRVGHGKAKRPSYNKDKNGHAHSGIIDRVALLKNAPARHNLLACITRCAGYMDSSVELSSGRAWFKASEPLIWELISSTYKFHKRGDLEPELPFLRVSRSLDAQSGIFTNDGGPLPVHDNLVVSEDGAVLIHGGRMSSNGEYSPAKLCVYLTQTSHAQPPQPPALARIIKATFEDYDVYHTTRDNGTLNLRAEQKYRNIWNLENPYGLFFSYGYQSFTKWLRNMDMPVPTRQGSPRKPTDTGRIIFTRDHSPWHDPRLMNGGPFAEQKREFLKQLLEAEARAWTAIASQKRRQNLHCCAFCTEELGADDQDDASVDGSPNDQFPDLCEECEEDLDLFDPFGAPHWVKVILNRTLQEELEAANDSSSIIPGFPSRDYNISTPILTHSYGLLSNDIPQVSDSEIPDFDLQTDDDSQPEHSDPRERELSKSPIRSYSVTQTMAMLRQRQNQRAHENRTKKRKRADA